MLRLGSPSRTPLIVTAVGALLWLGTLADWLWFGAKLPDALHWLVFGTGASAALCWCVWAASLRSNKPRTVALVGSLSYVALWQFTVFAADALAWDGVRVQLAQVGTGILFFVGLAWTVWGVERASHQYAERRRERGLPWQSVPSPALVRTAVRARRDVPNDIERIWNPLDLDAWYYGRNSRKLNQSLSALVSYSLAFMLAFLLMTRIGGCQEIYEMPAGGGEQQTIAQQVKVQKVIKKKFVINPFSAIRWKVPPIDEIKLQLTEITKHAYTVGYGAGEGAGFAGGTKRGKVRFIRLEYTGGDWDQDFGVGADLNMLIEYGIRTQHPVAERTESRRVAELANFPVGKSPPFVFMTGQKNISLSNSETKILCEYLIDKHGLLFCDNGGSRHFHNQFVGLMNQVLPSVRPVPIPLDDVIHRIPFQIPFLPYVAPHGGNEALGWKVDGRWVAYYHPGDIGDAWSDDHSGVKPEIWEACYQLGTNVIFYAHTEYSKWLAARSQEKQ